MADEFGVELRRVGSGTRLTFATGEALLSDWMAENARVVWIQRAEPWKLEKELIGKVNLVWPEYRIALVPLVNQALHLFAGPAEFAFRTATGVAKRGTDVADHAADVPIPDAAHTSGA